ncbi:MAG TPA: NADPH-dependent FMN reductase [Aquamicrobium sp.]|nr:NADPH-dependent FMN reductase [Aquamicrobium sp.]
MGHRREKMMSTRKIGVIVGSIRKESINRKLAEALMKLFPDDLRCEILRIDDIPVFNQDNETAPIESVARLRREVAEADGILFVTPEHNRSLPTALKNALDWASRPYGDNKWAGKPAGIAGASPGAVGTAAVQQHLRSVLGYLDMPTLGQPEVFIQFKDDLIDGQGGISVDSTREFLQGFVNRYVQWVEKFAR